MPHQYKATLISAQGDGSALSNSSTATSILPAQAKLPIAAGTFDVIGRRFVVEAEGRISNIVTTPGTLDLEFRLGSVIVGATGNWSLNTTAKTNVAWTLVWKFTLRAVGGGTSANFMHQAAFTSESVVGAASGTTLTIHGPASAPAVGTGFDSTAAQIPDLFAHFSTANSGNAITLHQFAITDCGP